MQYIDTNKNGIAIFYIPFGDMPGGECSIVDENRNFEPIDESFGHTRAVAIERAREKRKEISKNKLKTGLV